MQSWPPCGQASSVPKSQCTYILMHEDILVKQHHENRGIFQMNSPAIHSQYVQLSDSPSNVDCSNTNRVLCSMIVMSADRSSSGSFTFNHSILALVWNIAAATPPRIIVVQRLEPAIFKHILSGYAHLPWSLVGVRLRILTSPFPLKHSWGSRVQGLLLDSHLRTNK